MLYTILFFYRTKSNQSRRLSSIGFGNRTQSNSPKSSSSTMFDCRTNRTPIERLGSIGFDWFLVRFRSISYAGHKSIPPVPRRSRVWIPLKPWYFFSGFQLLLKLGNLLRWSPALHFHLQPQYKYELFHINFTDMTYWQSPLLFCGLYHFFDLWLASDWTPGELRFDDLLWHVAWRIYVVSVMEHLPLKFMLNISISLLQVMFQHKGQSLKQILMLHQVF